MKPLSYVALLLLVGVTIVQLSGQGERLGSLSSNTIVPTAAKPYVKDGFPVFEIHVPSPYTEVQIRASLTNFEPGFLVKLSGTPVYNFIPRLDAPKISDRWTYKSLGVDPPIIAAWSISNNRWEMTVDGNALHSYGGVAMFPWDVIAWHGPDNNDIGYAIRKELFVYHTCTTGSEAEGLSWGTGTGDPDPWVFFATQAANPLNEWDQFRRQKWQQSTSLSSQISVDGGAWSIGNTVTFQPSRGNLGASEWMQQNMDKLVWVYQLETAAGDHQLQPNGTPVWHVMQPREWRTSRITLPTP